MQDRTRTRVLLSAALVAFAWLLYLTIDDDFFSATSGDAAEEEDDLGAARDGAHEEEAIVAGDAGVPFAHFAPNVRPIELSAPSVHRDAPDAEHGRLSGRVVSAADGRPIEGASITFGHGEVGQTLSTDADGHFVLEPREPGTYVLALIEREGFLPFAPEWGHSPIRFEAVAGVHIDGLVLTLTDAVDYAVTVVDEAGTSISGATVSVFGADEGPRALAPITSTFVTDDEGVATVQAPDGAVLEARHEVHGQGRAHLGAGASATRAVRIVLHADPSEWLRGDLSIAGVVVGPRGEPIEGAMVTAVHITPAGNDLHRLHPELVATTDDRGAFALAHADRGRYALFVQKHGFARAEQRPVIAGARDVHITLTVEAAVRVRALDDATGEPVAALTVLVDRRRGALQTERLAVESAYDSRGEIEVRGLPAGPCRVRVSAPGYAISDPADTEARATPSLVTLRLRAGARIRGQVISTSNEAPLAGARVSLEGGFEEDDGPVVVVRAALTDPEGNFELAGVPVGTHSVVAWASGHHGRMRSGIVVPPTPDFTVELTPIDLSPVEEGETAQLELAGIGAVLSADGDLLRVRQVVEGGGAGEVGIVPGDVVLRVNGEPVEGLGFVGTIQQIRGPEGSYVALLIRRADGTEHLFRIPRRRVRA